MKKRAKRKYSLVLFDEANCKHKRFWALIYDLVVISQKNSRYTKLKVRREKRKKQIHKFSYVKFENAGSFRVPIVPKTHSICEWAYWVSNPPFSSGCSTTLGFVG